MDWRAACDVLCAHSGRHYMVVRETGLEPATTNLGSGDSASTQTQYSCRFRRLRRTRYSRKYSSPRRLGSNNAAHFFDIRLATCQCLMMTLGFALGYYITDSTCPIRIVGRNRRGSTRAAQPRRLTSMFSVGLRAMGGGGIVPLPLSCLAIRRGS
jgi:hypothetical protein